jgi:hypothetical protein
MVTHYKHPVQRTSGGTPTVRAEAFPRRYGAVATADGLGRRGGRHRTFAFGAIADRFSVVTNTWILSQDLMQSVRAGDNVNSLTNGSLYRRL